MKAFLKDNGDYCDYLLYNIIFMNSVLRMFVHVVVQFPLIK